MLENVLVCIKHGMGATVLKVKKKALDFVLERSMQVPTSVCYGLKEEVGAGEERWGVKKEKKEEKKRRRMEIKYLQRQREKARLEEMEISIRINSS